MINQYQTDLKTFKRTDQRRKGGGKSDVRHGSILGSILRGRKQSRTSPMVRCSAENPITIYFVHIPILHSCIQGDSAARYGACSRGRAWAARCTLQRPINMGRSCHEIECQPACDREERLRQRVVPLLEARLLRSSLDYYAVYVCQYTKSSLRLYSHTIRPLITFLNRTNTPMITNPPSLPHEPHQHLFHSLLPHLHPLQCFPHLLLKTHLLHRHRRQLRSHRFRRAENAFGNI